MLQIWGRREIGTIFWYADLKEGDHLEETGVDGKMILK
jgi:hypothetical protein